MTGLPELTASVKALATEKLGGRLVGVASVDRFSGGPVGHRLITPQYGARVRLVSVITNAPLVADEPLSEAVCLGEKCGLCVRNCPAQAFGDLHRLMMPGQTSPLARIDIEVCRSYYNRSGGHCGRECMTSCPLASRRLRRQSGSQVTAEVAA
jgi:epoxyqueuosine reductase